MEYFELVAFSDLRKLVIAAILGALIGLERELAGKDPSLRTFALICLGSCLFSIVSAYTAFGVPNADPGRIAAQIVTGIGFLGAGAIFRSRGGISGLTTAALIWMTAAVGMAVGLGHELLAIFSTLVGLIAILGLNIVHQGMRRFRPGFYDGGDS